jgi:hypothetical protein
MKIYPGIGSILNEPGGSVLNERVQMFKDLVKVCFFSLLGLPESIFYKIDIIERLGILASSEILSDCVTRPSNQRALSPDIQWVPVP